MRTEELISVREYLSTSYDPDCDYVDGVVLERNVGEKDHSKLQRFFVVYFYNRRTAWNAHVYPEQRIQVSRTRFRVPDVCVVVGKEPEEQIFTTPPFICIEILSPEDRLTAVQEKVEDYLKMGVPHVWIVDPRTRKAYRASAQGLLEIHELRTENPEVVISLDEIFED